MKGCKLASFFTICGLVCGSLLTSLIYTQVIYAAGTVDCYPSHIPADASFSGGEMTSGTAFAVYATVTGLSGSCMGPKLYVYGATRSQNDAHTWNNGEWKSPTSAWDSFSSVTYSDGTWSGWVVGAVKSGSTYTNLDVGIHCSDNEYTSTVNVTAMNMSASGGWLEGHIYSDAEKTTGYQNIVVLAKDGDGNILGTYATEDNSVDEGYTSSDAGYFKLAVGSTISSLEYRDTSNNSVTGYTKTNPPWTVDAGDMKDIDQPTAITISSFTAHLIAPQGNFFHWQWAVGLVLVGGAVVRRLLER